jgi:hypothetical protein
MAGLFQKIMRSVMATMQDPEDYVVKSDVANLAPAILEVMDVARAHGVVCWLCYGALLGLVRENRLLPWNNDAELGCWHNDRIGDKFQLITDELNKRGYHTTYYSSNGSVAVRRKGVIVNINCFWREGEYAVRPHEGPSAHDHVGILAYLLYWFATLMVSYPAGFLGNTFRPLSRNELLRIIIVSIIRLQPRALRRGLFLLMLKGSIKCGGIFQKTGIPKVYFNKFVMLDFYGGKVLVPDEPERLLWFIYGEGWRTPKVDWSFYDDKNKVDSGILFIDEVWDYRQMDVV